MRAKFHCNRHITVQDIQDYVNLIFLGHSVDHFSQPSANIKTATKVKVMKSVVWAVFQYGVEGWTLKKSDRNRIETFEMWCWRKMLSISWQEHRTNDSILTELGLERESMGRVAKLKLQYFGHITRGSAGQLALTVLEGIMEGSVAITAGVHILRR